MPLSDDIQEQRAKYMRGELSHQQYYRWLRQSIGVSSEWIIKAIGANAIRTSRDPHFNDIPLRRWDGLHPNFDYAARHVARVPWSLSDSVCCAKAAARDWLLSQHKPGETYRTEEEHGAVSARGRIMLDPDAVARGHDRPWLVFVRGDCMDGFETLGVARKYLERTHNLFVIVPERAPCDHTQP